ncbi:MAG: diadenylate cyclase [Syntrophobacteraceae bacterium]|nr:diadenylate cyclase [Syntrophobacteraceae bacterium]
MGGLLTFISTIRWQDIVDVLINSYILLRVYILFQGTNAFRVLVGVTSLWLAQELAASLGLILTSWAIRGITAAAAIIIIVVFRNEIRSVLQVRNIKTFLWGFPAREQRTPVDIITDSVFQMAQKRIGALLVFPGNQALGEVVHGGIPWNGQVSNEMLLSIFWPKGPVHDGAAIVRGEQIVEVGALLPLTHRQDLPSEYGTRHRAAAGLAEAADALVVVVSEERGKVSVAKGRDLTPVADGQELSQAIKRHLNMPEISPVHQRKRERLKFASAGFVSFLIISGIWLGFTRGQDTIIALNVPIEYVHRPASYDILDTSVDEARLQLFGSSALIRSIGPEQVAVRIDLSKATEGRNAFAITQDDVILPPGISLNRIKPSTLEVTLDIPTTRQIPVQVDWTSRLPKDMDLTDVSLSPTSVSVTGGSTTLAKVDTIYTCPVRLDSLPKSGRTTAEIVLSPPSLKLSPSSTGLVTIHYRLVKSRTPQHQ